MPANSVPPSVPLSWVKTLGALVAYAIASIYLTSELWADPTNRVISTNAEDYSLFQWFMAHAVHVVTHGENPLFTHAMNAPDGVNMMANTSMLAIAIPFVPVTLLFGAATSLVLVFTLSYFATAAAWYWLLSRHLLQHKGAAFVGGAFLGFSPAMIAHGCGQPNLVAQFMIPLLIWAVLRLRTPGRTAIIGNGIVLGLFAVIQAFINEEVLFLAALAMLIFCVAYALMRWNEVKGYIRNVLAGLGVATLTALPLLAYPLWFQFFGPQSYHGLPDFLGNYTAPIGSYVTIPRQSIAGDTESAALMTLSACEEHTFFGWPLVIALLASIAWLIRIAAMRALAITGLAFVSLAFGDYMTFGNVIIPGPWNYMHHLPLFNAVTPARFGLITAIIAGLILALSVDEGVRVAQGRRSIAWLPYAIAAAILLPLVPRPLPAEAKPVPEFFSTGTWREYIPPGKSLVSVPLPSRNQQALRWAARTNGDFDLASGYFLGPDGLTGTGRFSAPPRPTEDLLLSVAFGGNPGAVTEAQRAQAVEDLRFWRASTVGLNVDHPHVDAVREYVTDLLGVQSQQVEGMWVWDVRTL